MSFINLTDRVSIHPPYLEEVSDSYTDVHTRAHTHKHAHIHIHTYTHTHIQTHTYVYRHIHTYSYTYILIHTYIHTHSQTKKARIWRGSLAIKSLFCSCRAPKFSSQHPRAVAYNHCNLISRGIQIPLATEWRPHMHSHTYLYIYVI